MNPQKIYVYGAGGHGKAVANILLARGDARFVGFVDDRSELKGSKILGYPVFGDGAWLQQQSGRTRITVALAVGENWARQRIARKCMAWGAELATLVHPAASVAESVQLGPGTVVMAQAVINPCASIGIGVIVNSAAVIEHDGQVGDFAHVAPNSTMGGASRLGEFSQLGIGSVVIHCVRIGDNTIVGAGAVVTRDIPDKVIAFGVPARIHRSLTTS